MPRLKYRLMRHTDEGVTEARFPLRHRVERVFEDAPLEPGDLLVFQKRTRVGGWVTLDKRIGK